MTAYEEHTMGWGLAPSRLAREDVAAIRRLYREAHTVVVQNWLSQSRVRIRLHADRDDDRKLALAKLGAEAPHVLVLVAVHENDFEVSVHAAFTSSETRHESRHVALHKFQRRASVKEWTRILSRHCRHAFGVLKLMRSRVADVYMKPRPRIAARAARPTAQSVESS